MRWRRLDLKRVIAERGSASTFIRAMSESFSRNSASPSISARPRHPAQDERTIEAFAKNFPRALKVHIDGPPETTPVEIWFEDEARIGQKNGQKFGNGPCGERGQGSPPTSATDNAYLFGAICPARGVSGPRAALRRR